MKKLYILSLIAAGLLVSGCSKENPFDSQNGEGSVLKSALAVDVQADAIMQTRAGAEVNIDDFNIIFSLDGVAEPAARFKYGEMPEIVTLPAGTYTCTATYGEDRDAAWESPFYRGVSAPFTVSAYEITSYIDPIECRLENIMVSVTFDPTLRIAMSADSYVEVKVGSSSALNFSTAEADANKAGFFKHSDEVSLVATFHGTVNGEETVETKSLNNIGKGNHYKIKFKLHGGAEGNATGDVSGALNVDASVSVVDVAANVPVGEDEVLDDSERPTEAEDPGSDPGSDPQNPPTPPAGNAPTIIGEAPVNIDGVNQVSDLTTCIVKIHSDAGITAFTCDIVSEALSPEELENFQLSDHLDLVNTPEDMAEALASMGFPVNCGGEHDLELNLTGFLVPLKALGSCEHHFVLTVTDANGTTKKTLIINV